MILIQLFLSFLQIGFTSFGGLSMIPLISSEMSIHGWMTDAEISDIIAIAEMTPGPLGLNCGTFVGIRVAGFIGALIANAGMLMPTFTICAVAAFFLERFKNSTFLKKIMENVRPTCIGLIWAVLFNLTQTNYSFHGEIQWYSVIIGILSVYLLVRRKWSIPKVIILAAILGAIFSP